MVQHLHGGGSVDILVTMETKPERIKRIVHRRLGKFHKFFLRRLGIALDQPLQHWFGFGPDSVLMVVSFCSCAAAIPTQALDIQTSASVMATQLVSFISIALDKGHIEDQFQVLVHFPAVLVVPFHACFLQISVRLEQNGQDRV